MQFITDIKTRQDIIVDKQGEIYLWIEDGYLLDANVKSRIEKAEDADVAIIRWLNIADSTGEMIIPDECKLLPIEFFRPISSGRQKEIGWRIIDCDECLLGKFIKCKRNPFACPEKT